VILLVRIDLEVDEKVHDARMRARDGEMEGVLEPHCGVILLLHSFWSAWLA
jgi:hypothetical protein